MPQRTGGDRINKFKQYIYKVLIAGPDTELVIYCNCEQEGQAEAYDIPTLSLQNYDLVKAEGKMRMREAHRTAQKDNLSTLGAAQESWGFVAKACGEEEV